MERASSSTACSSSSSAAAAAPPGGSFQPALVVGKSVHVLIEPRTVPLPATVEFVVAEEVSLRVVVPPKGPRIEADAMAMITADGGKWRGEVSWFQTDHLDDEEPGFYHFVWIRMGPGTSPVNQVSPESAKNVLVMVNPVRQREPHKVKVNLNVIPTNESSQAMVEVDLHVTTQARIGVDGFGNIERFLIDKTLQSLNVEVVAIYSPVPPKTMVELWKSPNVSISEKDDQTVIFQMRYYEQSKKFFEEEKKKHVEMKKEAKRKVEEDEVKRKDVNAEEKEKRIYIKTTQMEVTVFSERNQVSWEKVNADFVVECSTCFNNDKDVRSNDLVQSQIKVHDMNESLNSCLGGLPKDLACHLYVVVPIVGAQYNSGTTEDPVKQLLQILDDQELVRRTATFNIVISSKNAAKAVRRVKLLRDWNEESTSAFLATAVSRKTIHADSNISNVDLHVTLEKAENYSDTEDVHIWSYDAETLIAIMGLCLDIIRCVPVGGCRLKLI